MLNATKVVRPLGTMVAYGFPDHDFRHDLELARRLGASVLEIFPDWRRLPDPVALKNQVIAAGFTVHSAHGCWSSQSIEAQNVNLADFDPIRRQASIDDLKRCVDWLKLASGTCLVVHPGGISAPAQSSARRAALRESLLALADHACGMGVILCVENMPPGVHPGSRMADLAELVAEIDRPELALAIDTGHANLSADPRTETIAAGTRLRTTHVHDNSGSQDSHLPPGLGSIDWESWAIALDEIGYSGPVILECIRHLRKFPESITQQFLTRLRSLSTEPQLREELATRPG